MNFDQILQPPLIGLPNVAALNVHPSLLPKLRGPCPVLWAQARQERISGATVHAIEDRTIDTARPCQGRSADRWRKLGRRTDDAVLLAGARALPDALARLAGRQGGGTSAASLDGQYLGYPTAAQMKDFRARRASPLPPGVTPPAWSWQLLA